MEARMERLPPKVSSSGLFWCYEKSTCSLWLWRCSRCGCPLWCARAGNACGEGATEEERERAGEQLEEGAGGDGGTLSGQKWRSVTCQIEMEEPTEERSLLGRVPPTCALPNHNQKHKQLDGPTCKGKNPLLQTHTHICARHGHRCTISPNERSSCARRWRWERRHCLPRRFAAARHENTPTQRWLSPQAVYLLGDTVLFHVHAGFETHQCLACVFPEGCFLGIISVLFYAPRWSQKTLRLQTSSGVQINAHPERTSINFLQFFLCKAVFLFCLRVYTVDCSL